jgi:hypothetical protein
MPFIQLDDQITEHPKILQAGAVAAWVWTSAIAYCQRQLTDGFVPAAAVPRLAQEATPKVLARLVSLHLLDRVDGGFLVHDYLDHNPSRVTVLRRRAEAAQRKERSRGIRDGRVTGRVTPTVTDESSRARIPTPTPTPTTTDPKSGSVDAPPRPTLVPFDDEYGAMPTRKRNPAMAWEGQREGLGVPDKLHRDLLSRLGTPDEAALLAWYAETERAWQGRAVGETCWQFWNARFTEWQGQTPTARRGHRPYGVGVTAPSSSVAVVDPDYNGAPYRFHCQHRPTCTTWPQHRDMDADTAVSA